MKKVLIVDDAAYMRMMLKEILLDHGYEIVGEAENGLEAVEKFTELRPDVVTMDITMPEMDGIDAVKKIRSIAPEAIIIMCSAMGQQNLVMKSLEAGAKDFVVKPFEPERIIQTLESVIA